MFQFGSSCSLSYQGLSIKYYPASGIVCLTDLWRAQCSRASQRPLAWVRLEATQKLLKRLAWANSVDPLWSERSQPGQKPEQLIIAIPGILETVNDHNDLLTYATTNLAVVYAYYLAPECYEWAQVNLAKETALVDQWLAQQSHVESQKQHKTFTRRAVIAAGWSIPIVSALALNQRAAAQVSAGRTSTRTTNTTGTTNTGINNTTGTTNTGINNTTGTTNTGVNNTTRTTTNTGINNTTGITNTGINNTTGTTNTGINNTTGTTNTGINNTTGTTNTGLNNTTGTTNTGLNNSGIINTGINNTGTTTGIGSTTTGTTTGIATTTSGTTTGIGSTTTGTTTGIATSTTGIGNTTSP